MYHSTRWSVVLHHVFLCLMLTAYSVADNYPSNANTVKPCARRKNAIVTQGPLCEWDEVAKEYSADSRDLCRGALKQECPEFNEASCVLMNDYHSCKLRYYAKRNTWMEVFYANQYPPDFFENPEVNTYDIIEIHRMVDPEYVKDFGNVSQPDYPNNVLDPQGKRGLKWMDVKDPKPHSFSSTRVLCENGTDFRCTDENIPGSSFRYLHENYRDWFDPKAKIPRTPYEDQVNATIEIVTESKCRYANMGEPVVEFSRGKRVPTCTTFFRRIGVPAGDGLTVTNFIFLESQLILGVSIDSLLILNESEQFSVRYAHWNIEDVGTRDLIFKDKNWKGSVRLP